MWRNLRFTPEAFSYTTGTLPASQSCMRGSRGNVFRTLLAPAGAARSTPVLIPQKLARFGGLFSPDGNRITKIHGATFAHHVRGG